MTDWNFYVLRVYTSYARNRDAFDAFVAGVITEVGRQEDTPQSPLRHITPCPPDIRNPKRWDTALGMSEVVWTHVEEISAPVGRLGALVRFRLPQHVAVPQGWFAQLEAREYPFDVMWVNEDREEFGTYNSEDDEPVLRLMTRRMSEAAYRSVVVDCVGPSALLSCRVAGCYAPMKWKLRMLDTDPEHVAEREKLEDDFGDPRLAKYRVYCPECHPEEDDDDDFFEALAAARPAADGVRGASGASQPRGPRWQCPKCGPAKADDHFVTDVRRYVNSDDMEVNADEWGPTLCHQCSTEAIDLWAKRP